MAQPTWQNSLLGSADAIGAGGIARFLMDAPAKYTPPVWSGDYSDQQRREWYYSLAQDPDTQKKYADFEKRAFPAMVNRLAQFRNFLQYSLDSDIPPVTDQTLANIGGRILGKPYDPEDKYAEDYTNKFLSWLKESSTGYLKPDQSVTFEEKAAWDIDPSLQNSLNSNYRLTETGQSNLDKERDYELLRTFQTDPVHRPIFLQSAPTTAAFSGISALTYDGTGMSSLQLANTLSGTPAAAMENALMWDDHYQERMQKQPGYWNDMFGGAVLPSGSATNIFGLGRKTVDGDSAVGRWTRWLSGPMKRSDATEQQREDYNNFMTLRYRQTPIGSGGDVFGEQSDQARELTRKAEEMEVQDERIISDNFPGVINAVNDATGLNIAPFYPSAFVNDLGMVGPNIAGDPLNAAIFLPSAALGLATRGLSGLGHALLAQASDAPSEGAFNTAISLTNTPQSAWDYLSKPDPGVSLRDASGNIPDPLNRKSYERALKSKVDGRQTILQGMQTWLKNNVPNYGKKQPVFGPSFASPQAWGAAPKQ
jgi:hypothetical protein